ncbi:Protein bicaudal C protein 1 [Fasciola gigantica]|uniref:Protein bicaudal C protein 1 n=1 Tax=Fasciola gigantica TaxID=46835 RepID=A0A504Z3U3_FASGI|nr:Protein bicaudal C protein 1 [Fasciola gigantica]
MSQYFGSVNRAENDFPISVTDLVSWTSSESSLTSTVRTSSQTNRVTLKIDVPHTDHSHVIGRGGRNIKAVMLDTQCHIHFPDSNRASTAEKSNQVSISGHVTRVDRARQRIRDMLPIEFTFTLPFGRNSQPSAFRNSPIVRQLEELHNVEVCFRNIYSLFGSHVVVGVKGLSCNSRQTKAACQTLMQFYYGPNTVVPVSMSINMDPNYQVNFLGHRTPEDLSRLVLQTTGALVTVQDARYLSEVDTSAANNPSNSAPRLQQLNLARKARAKPVTIEISGTVDSVFLARQLISSVVIRTIEKNIRSLYSTWQLITGIIHQFASHPIPTALNTPRGSRDVATSSSCNSFSDQQTTKGRNGSRLPLLQNSESSNRSPLLALNASDWNSSSHSNFLPLTCSAQSSHADSLVDPPGMDTIGFEQNSQLRLTSRISTTPNWSSSENRLPNIHTPITTSFREEMSTTHGRTANLFQPHSNHNPPPRGLRATVLAELNSFTNLN